MAEMLGQQSLTSKAKRKARQGFEDSTLAVAHLENGGHESGEEPLDEKMGGERKNVDDLLPLGVR